KIFTKVMRTDPTIVKEKVNILISKLKSNNIQYKVGSPDELLVRLNEQFPGDIGIFCVFMFNYIRLEPGEAIFLGANEPHAYLSGGRINFFFLIFFYCNLFEFIYFKRSMTHN